ncbi:LytR/AlgR family response regulator transcription factor [Scleromatobacter humisilvae]|uniref:Response regulator n=1 Tax=Scleromatobacter humisilvae TaxID=2897159 RepID=A0A9X1YGJ4_9BURK|nr:response regulator [Scleromatobacter humisilvae]MCK9684430.1 response regulator [Scleromatobacter humisilvae]
MTSSPGLRALIVDDEDLARRLIREYLQGHADIDIVGECENGLDAVKQIGALQPDLVFLDIQMPRLTGLEVLELTGRRAGVIFTTAYDEHAIKAFELHAVDYLLKPFSKARFDDALARARTLHAPAAPAPGIDALVARRNAPLERILIRDREQVHVIPIEQVECIEAQGDYLAIHVDGKCHLKPQRISEIEEQLDPARFLRVHRSFIISLAHLQAIERPGPDRHAARLRSGKRVPISRSGYEKLRTLV